MTRLEWIRSLTAEELAHELTWVTVGLIAKIHRGEYCRWLCKDKLIDRTRTDICPHPEKCLAIWLMEEVDD